MNSVTSQIILSDAAPREKWGQILRSILRNRWVYHSIFWILYYAVFAFVIAYAVFQVKDPVFYYQLTLFFPLDMALAYFNIYFLIPRFLSKRKYVAYTIYVLMAVNMAVILNLSLKQIFTNYGSIYYAATASFSLTHFLTGNVEHIYMLAFTAAIKFAKDWIQQQQKIKEREKIYLETELNFLKSQIQPHFFFNTLNNLYSLTLKKSDQAPEVVLKLSGLMSYMLYESNSAFVSLEKEIEYLQNYLDLEKLRFGDRLSLHLHIRGKIAEARIPPMILILFVENSFKHGVRNNLNRIHIYVELEIEEGRLQFSVKNPIPELNLKAVNSGIGLRNARRRLELLYGKGYSLETKEKDQFFTAVLNIPVC